MTKPGSSSVSHFISQHGKPYLPAEDKYFRLPFSRNIDHASKASAVYNMHMYWVKQDPAVVRQYIEHYTDQGDIVLDAFCGSGMTGVAALSSGRNAVLGDISPACIHISRNYITPVNVSELGSAYRQVMAKALPEIEPLYRTHCHNCGYPEAQIAHTILSDVYRCPRCGKEILLGEAERWKHMKAGEKIGKLACSCGSEFTKDKAEFVRVEPIEIRVDCPRCKTKGEKKARPLDESDWQDYINIEGGPIKVTHEGNDEWDGYEFTPSRAFAGEIGTTVLLKILGQSDLSVAQPRRIPYWYPKDVTFFGDEPRRNLKRGITHPWQMFTRRNLIALSILQHYIDEIKETAVREKLKFVFTGILFSVDMQYRWRIGGGGGGRGTLYIPSLISEVNVLNAYSNKFVDLVKGLKDITYTRDTAAYISNCDASNWADLSNNSIDYAFYDPPYGSNINYAELNVMWEAWLGEFTHIEQEIIENRHQNKDRGKYEQMMTQALREAYRVLKPGRWLSLVYSYSDPSMYRAVQNMATMAGFLQSGDVMHVESTMKTKLQLDSDKTQQRYLVINFQKPVNPSAANGDLEKADIEFKVISLVQEYLQRQGGQPRARIYDEVIKQLFTSVQIEKFDLDAVLRNFFRKVGDNWYAPGTLVTRQASTLVKKNQLPLMKEVGNPEADTVILLQDFLRQHGTLPLSELREYYLRETPIYWQEIIKFEQAVEGFVIKDGKVRLTTVEEQAALQNTLTRYQKAKIQRYLATSSNSAAGDREICHWIEFCYQNELFPEAVKLFSQLNLAVLEPSEQQTIKRIVDVCRLMLEEEEKNL